MYRWRILSRRLDRFTIKKVIMIIKVCVLLHNMCLRSNRSREIEVCRNDAVKNPFDPACPQRGVVQRYRLHLDSYTEQFAAKEGDENYKYMSSRNEKEAKRLGKATRELLVTSLHSRGFSRDTARGKKACASSQH